MNITKRTFLAAGSAAVLTGAVARPALAIEGESGLIIAILAAAELKLEGGGGGKVAVQDLSIAAINKAEPAARSTVLGKDLEARLSKQFPETNFDGAIVKAVMKAFPKGLTEGEHEIAAAGKGPKWSIKLTIVIKF